MPLQPPPLHRGFAISVVGEVRTQRLNAPPSRSGAALPQSSPPQIVRFEARDVDNADEVVSAGDALEIVFDRLARPPARLCSGRAEGGCAASGGRGFVDSLFEFSQPLGVAYSGAWSNAFTFVITITDAANASVHLGTTGPSSDGDSDGGVVGDAHVGPSTVTTHHWAVPGSATSQVLRVG